MVRLETEMCPHCEQEHDYHADVESDGYIVVCKGCDRKIFLCDACMHSEDNEGMYCDWHKTSTGSACFRGEIKEK